MRRLWWRWTSWRNLMFARRHSKRIREMELRRYARTGNPFHNPDWRP